MDDRIADKNEDIEIDFARLFGALVKKVWLVGAVAILCSVVTFLGTIFFVTPLYQSSAMFYVQNSSGDPSMSITSGELSASRGLVESYIVILNTRQTLKDVMDHAGVNRSFREVEDMISAEAVDGTEIFRVVVTSPDPQEAERLANAIAHVLPMRISKIIEGTSARIVDSAVLPSRPSSPNKTKISLIGFVVGLVLSAGFVIIRELTDTRIRREEDITRNCDYPVLVSVLNLESYKILWTKLLHFFKDAERCPVIGITGAMAGEDKSLSAVNLAYATGQLGKRVLLMDCNLRSTTLAERISVKNHPGLSDFLNGQVGADSLLQRCEIKDVHVIASGATHPNPMELLGSDRMEQIISVLKKFYDCILLDLPPIGEVGDAMVAANLTDGMLLVVYQNDCDEDSLKDAIRQLEFMDAKILGIVFHCIAEESCGKRKPRKSPEKEPGVPLKNLPEIKSGLEL